MEGPRRSPVRHPVENSADAPLDPKVIEQLEQRTRPRPPPTPARDDEMTDPPGTDHSGAHVEHHEPTEP